MRPRRCPLLIAALLLGTATSLAARAQASAHPLVKHAGEPAPGALNAPDKPPVLHFSLPDAPEKRLIEQHCITCHDLTRIENAGGTRLGWTRRLQRMIARGAKLPLQDVPAVATYLARQFPVRLRPDAAPDDVPPEGVPR